MRTINIELIEEEIQSLLSMKDICIFEDIENEIQIKISLPHTKENVMREDILWRYNNQEYWHEELWEDEENE